MPVHVVMPQMGESIAEGTIVKWLKQEGEQVKKDEPLLEISTDKVDAEVPAPANGILAKIHYGPGSTVPVETVIAEIAAEGEAVSGAPAPAQATAPPAPAAVPSPASTTPSAPFEQEPAPAAPPAEVFAPASAPPPAAIPGGPETEALRRRSSPLVRRIAAEHGIDLAQVPGTGLHGRVTKDDILAYIEQRKAVTAPTAPPAPAPAAAPAVAAAPPPAPPRPAPPVAAPAPPTFAGDEYREPMSIMRQRIAEHMVASRRTSPHVHTVFEVDVSHIVRLREKYKDQWEQQYGVKLTYTSFYLEAVIDALKAFPILNASIDGNDIVYHRHINLGVAVALPHGLIVPVIKHAEELSLLGLQRALTDLATRARNKQLKPEEVHGSTFSITNPGPYGNLFGLPIINQPNVAILSIGNMQRRPVVVRDALGREGIGISDMVYLALSFDHRLIDGAVADQFMAHIKAFIQEGRFSLS
ncbi:MAG: dihydrolipoamide acetyltransferase family protein [Thermoanaerobaculum sp.]|nr:dihydrolipoamide acetyltransferase family protein [Thermoanaerobaculum sp.]